jgi:NO-binding membrane sensor protein with MHYT domain
MHYTGMWALEVPGRVTWLPGLVIASVVTGMIFASGALTVATCYRGKLQSLLAALLLTLAIVSHHFTAMGAPTSIVGKSGKLWLRATRQVSCSKAPTAASSP